MGILIKEGTTKRDWLKLAGAAAETAFKSLTLGKDGFSAAISLLFRIFETLRGNDSTERRASRLVLEILSYAIAKTICSTPLKRTPLEAELQALVAHLLARTETLAEQREILLESSHLVDPAAFFLFEDIALRLFEELKQNEPKLREADLVATYQMALVEGLSRVRTRSPEYYAPVFDVLSGSTAHGDAKALAWTEYRKLLVRRFEDDLIFGEDGSGGVRLGQVYQQLRGFWVEEDDDVVNLAASLRSNETHHVEMLESLVQEWLESANPKDYIRLASGGPGSGKSTFAKHLAASLALQPRWRILFVPLQRLKGEGPLEERINEYFRLQLDEPFGVETAPLLSVGRDGHRDWLIIFDGLDEIAKEGASSESAAQDFASALADLRGRMGSAAVRFLVLGRAPSMQEARRRLGLGGKGTLHVAGMAPFSKVKNNSQHVSCSDPKLLADIDQRSEFWGRWAIAKGLPIDLPEAMRADELLDLTNEPLLAYLLILSGYASDRWRDAAENRNRIYQAIFDQIWERERTKQTRLHLNELGREGFESLLQALGLAAWRGGGRTGDEATFLAVRNIFMRPDILEKAEMCGAADLSNVALLFYTRRDEQGGRGYEFLHKSFGEYLTARALLDAYLRWEKQVSDPTSDFSLTEFLRRWINLVGATSVTQEIVAFLRNEIRLFGSRMDKRAPWAPVRKLVQVAEKLVDSAVRDGFPFPDEKTRWRSAEIQQRNAEVALMCLLNALSRTAYPDELLKAKSQDGGWTPGPIKITEFEKEGQFDRLLLRLVEPTNSWVEADDFSGPYSSSLVFSTFSRLALQKNLQIMGTYFVNGNFFGADLSGLDLIGCFFMNCDLSGTDFGTASIELCVFADCNFTGANLKSVEFGDTFFNKLSLKSASLTSKQRKSVNRDRGVRFGIFGGALKTRRQDRGAT